MRELDTVVLRRDLPEFGLIEGDVGAVVHVHGADACEVEFVTGDGRTVAVASLTSADLRPMDRDELLHARSVTHR